MNKPAFQLFGRHACDYLRERLGEGEWSRDEFIKTITELETSTLRELLFWKEALRQYYEWEIIKRSPHYFIFKYIKTIDPHHSTPVRPFPCKDYLWWIISLIHENQFIAIMKSRQVLITWTICAYILWDAITKPYRFHVVESRKRELAGFNEQLSLLNRIEFMYNHLPQWMRARNPMEIRKKAYKLIFTKTHSEILAVSQEATEGRGLTINILFMDEVAFQEHGRTAWNSFRPTLGKNSKAILVSTPQGKNWFYRLLVDEE